MAVKLPDKNIYDPQVKQDPEPAAPNPYYAPEGARVDTNASGGSGDEVYNYIAGGASPDAPSTGGQTVYNKTTGQMVDQYKPLNRYPGNPITSGYTAWPEEKYPEATQTWMAKQTAEGNTPTSEEVNLFNSGLASGHPFPLTSSERQRGWKYSTGKPIGMYEYGPWYGDLVPEGSIVYTDAQGNPIGRWSGQGSPKRGPVRDAFEAGLFMLPENYTTSDWEMASFLSDLDQRGIKSQATIPGVYEPGNDYSTWQTGLVNQSNVKWQNYYKASEDEAGEIIREALNNKEIDMDTATKLQKARREYNQEMFNYNNPYPSDPAYYTPFPEEATTGEPALPEYSPFVAPPLISQKDVIPGTWFKGNWIPQGGTVNPREAAALRESGQYPTNDPMNYGGPGSTGQYQQEVQKIETGTEEQDFITHLNTMGISPNSNVWLQGKFGDLYSMWKNTGASSPFMDWVQTYLTEGYPQEYASLPIEYRRADTTANYNPRTRWINY